MTNIVYNMDCMEYMRTLPDKAFELAIVDPPYGINIAENMGKRKRNSTYTTNKRKTQEWDNAPPTDEYFKQVFRVSENQIIWGGNYFSLPPCKCFIIWNKPEISENVSPKHKRFWKAGGNRAFEGACRKERKDGF